jgi:lincosamide nucleotidyltransferase A/C/D/E
VRSEQVAALVGEMENHGVRLWLMGGWGVDALVGEQTRDHHDVDVLVRVVDLERYIDRLRALEFEPAYVWDDETRAVHHASWSTSRALPTAFVERHTDGREVDTHVLDVDAAGEPVALWNTTVRFTWEGLGGEGVVDGLRVRCLSVALQREAHEGYELPPHHVEDLRRLVDLESSAS